MRTLKQKARQKAYMKVYRAANKEKLKAAQRAYYVANQEKLIAAAKAYRAAHLVEVKTRAKVHRDSEHPNYPGWTKQQVSNLKFAHGISPAEWQAFWRVQDGKCKACGAQLTRAQTGTHSNQLTVACVDHDHQLKYIRGLVCHACNLKIGHWERMPEYIHEYIRATFSTLQLVQETYT